MFGTQIRLGVKIGGGFGLLIVLLISISLGSFGGLHVIGNLSRLVVSHNHDKAFMLAKEIDHLNWMAKINELFLKDDVITLQVETDDHKCDFGKWLYSPEIQEMAAQGGDKAALFKAIEAPHRRLHESAIAIRERYVGYDRNVAALLPQFRIDHLNLVKNLQTLLLTGRSFSSEPDHQQTALGRWLRSSQTNDSELRRLVTAWEEPHLRLYQSAQNIVKAMARGDQAAAATIFNDRALVAETELATHYERTMAWLETAMAREQEARHIYDNQTTAAYGEIAILLHQLRGVVDSAVQQDNSHLAGVIALINRSVTALAVFGVISGTLMAFFIFRGVTRPLKQAIKGLTQGASEVIIASDHIAASSQVLAEGTAEQASALEETSASLEELSSMTRQNADNAGRADSHMQSINAVVETTSTAMSELTQSMQDITRAGEDTRKIVQTIDEIAFQTNLLALNAAVEAARAGQAGAGFAVVADEVRNLAMRAAEAAKNTAHLIDETVKKTGIGSELVSKTSASFSQVTQSTTQIAALVKEISEASVEQSVGISQINRAIAEMDKVVQQIAAGAEESAAAADELHSQASRSQQHVDDMVALIFGTTGAAPRRPPLPQQPAHRALPARNTEQKNSPALSPTTGPDDFDDF